MNFLILKLICKLKKIIHSFPKIKNSSSIYHTFLKISHFFNFRRIRAHPVPSFVPKIKSTLLKFSIAFEISLLNFEETSFWDILNHCVQNIVSSISKFSHSLFKCFHFLIQLYFLNAIRQACSGCIGTRLSLQE